ncbi:hypothetical protein [Cellvibrio sp.]|uniref:hypothetical protein n=1 Tax=Cellvibrio sp. TaxID=1965322 RepID=UPI0039648A32
MLKKFIALILIFAVTACASSPKNQRQAKLDAVACPENRPQLCTREYLPVCATRDTGVRCITAPCPSSEQLTYGNACTACADSKVLEYRSGSCDKPETKH